MNLEQKKVNEQYFKKMFSILNENGIWIWPDTGHVFTKKQDKLVGNKQAVKAIREIITRKFFEENFSTLD